jgi:hypothetical protein
LSKMEMKELYLAHSYAKYFLFISQGLPYSLTIYLNPTCTFKVKDNPKFGSYLFLCGIRKCSLLTYWISLASYWYFDRVNQSNFKFSVNWQKEIS